jgi:hypothetical protein
MATAWRMPVQVWRHQRHTRFSRNDVRHHAIRDELQRLAGDLTAFRCAERQL